MTHIVKSLSKIEVDGKHQIFVRVNLTRTNRPRLKTGIFIKKKFFICNEISKPKYVRCKSEEIEEMDEASKALDNFLTKVEFIISTKDISSISKEWLEAQLFDKNKSPGERSSVQKQENSSTEEKNVYKAVYEFFEQYYTSKNLSLSRQRRFACLKRLLIRFELFQQLMGDSQFTLKVHQICAEHLLYFSVFCRSQGDLSKSYPRIFSTIQQKLSEIFPYVREGLTLTDLENCSENYIIDLLKDLRAIFKWLIQKQILDINVFDELTLEERRYIAHPVFLTIEERRLLMELDLSSNRRLAVQRDIFVFQCLTGCRYGDLIELTSDNIYDDKYLQYVPNKTKLSVNRVCPRVPLTQEALLLIKKYEGKDKKGRLFPFISNNKYNERLKELFEKAGLTRMVFVLNPRTGAPQQVPLNTVASSHMARRTFIGNLYNKIKDPVIISAMSGHAEHSRAFSRYRDIGDDARREVIDKIQ